MAISAKEKRRAARNARLAAALRENLRRRKAQARTRRRGAASSGEAENPADGGAGIGKNTPRIE
jgi:hypothetical protein